MDGKKRGRKKLLCSLGKRKRYTFFLYPIEFQKMKIEFQKLKRQREKYTKKENEDDQTR